MFPAEIYHYIVSKMDGFERENMRLVCKMFNEFRFVISSKNPARDREVLLIDCNRRFYELFEYGHLDIIKQCYKRYGNYCVIIECAYKYGFIEFARDLYVKHGKRDIIISLAHVCENDNIEAINMAVYYGAIDYMSGLRNLCKRGNLELFDYLLTLSHIDPVMNTFISEACISGNINMVRRIMRFPVKDDSVWNDGLLSACEGGNMDIINLMIDMGADNWDLGLYGACKGGYFDIVKMMIDMGANDWDLGFRGACEKGHFDIVKMMIDKGATHIPDISSTCSLGNIEIVKLLLETAEIKNHILLRGFGMAISYNHIELVKLLARDSFIKDSLSRITTETGIELIEFLIKRGAIVSLDNIANAVSQGDLDKVKCLLKYYIIADDEIFIHIDRIGHWLRDERIMKYLKSRY